VWIDREKGLQLRQDVTQADGRVVSTYFTSIEFRDPPREMLAFLPPADARFVERGQGRRPLTAADAARIARSWGGLLEPKSVPPGYQLRGYYRHTFNRRPALVAVYGAPGGGTLSIFQGPAIGMSGVAQRRKNLQVLSGRKGGADVTIVAPLPQNQLQRVMDSME
jgi:negative regulator of sigma E activity